MKKSYTNIAEVCVIAELFLGVTISFIAMLGGNNSIIRVLGFVGIFVSIILCAVFGTIVEISLNIAKCGEMLDKLVNGNQQNNEAPATAATGTVVTSNVATATENNPNAVVPVPVTPADLPQPVNNVEQPAQKNWFCSKCGKQNAPEVQFCTHCGQPRLSKPQEK